MKIKLISSIPFQAGALRQWTVVRYCSSLLGKIAGSLSPYITSILVSGKQLTVGVFGTSEQVIDHPLTPLEVQQVSTYKTLVFVTKLIF